jgi:hypothetical protein
MGQPQGGISFRRRPRWGSEPTATCSRGSNSTAGSRAVLRLWRVSSVMCAASGQAVEVIDRGCTRAPDPVRVRHGEHYVKPLWAPSGRRAQRPAHADRDRAHRLQPQPAAGGHGRPLRARVPNPVRVRHGEHYVKPRGALGQRAPRPAHPDRDQPYRPQPQPAAAGHPRPLRADVVNRQETRPRVLEPALAGRPFPDFIAGKAAPSGSRPGGPPQAIFSWRRSVGIRRWVEATHRREKAIRQKFSQPSASPEKCCSADGSTGFKTT